MVYSCNFGTTRMASYAILVGEYDQIHEGINFKRLETASL